MTQMIRMDVRPNQLVQSGHPPVLNTTTDTANTQAESPPLGPHHSLGSLGSNHSSDVVVVFLLVTMFAFALPSVLIVFLCVLFLAVLCALSEPSCGCFLFHEES
ncbi:hypothetical protein ILYODFUR_013143 [Ilyodon furcidens]|uniref:Uncharacterized protein n=1 Tax=Ilyodon furcidens TaxID=33524 RepID=A0ABV0URL5_9TELE